MQTTPVIDTDALDHVFGNGELIAGSVESVIRHAELMERESAAAAEPMAKLRMDLRRDFDLEVVERVTHRVFAYLCTVERDLSYIGVSADIFERHRRRAESFLAKIAPQVLDR